MASYQDSIDLATGTSPASSSVGVTKTTLGSGWSCDYASRIMVQFVGTITSGDATFRIDGSMDNINWVLGLAFLDVTQTTSTTLVTSKTISSTTPYGAAYITPGFKYIRVNVDVAGTGTYYAIAQAMAN